MRTRALCLFLCLGVPSLATAKKDMPTGEYKRFDALAARYLDGLFRAKPHMASYMGVHTYDDRLPDFSPKAVDVRRRELAAQAKELAAIPQGLLTDDRRTDARIMSDGIALERLYLDEIREWTWNPRLEDSFPYYDPRDMISDRLSNIVHGTYATAAVRKKAVIAQLNALPRFLGDEKVALEHPARVYLEQARKDNLGRIEFFSTELATFLKGDKNGERALGAAVEALKDYQKFLEKEPAAGALRDWRLGSELYRKKFPLALQTDLKPEDVVPRAEAVVKQAGTELYAVAAQLHKQLWPKEPAPPAFEKTDAAARAKVIRRVKDEISKDHPAAGDLVKAHAARLERLRAFIQEKNLIELPPADTLSVEPEPPYKRGVTAAEYLAPGMLDKSGPWHATYFVDPIDPTWPPEKVESYLRASNDYDVELTAAHEAYPGHHTQTWWARKQLDPLRATLWNPAYAEGWAVYCEDLLVALGYGGDKNLRYKMIDLEGTLTVAINVLLDIGLHGGNMSDADAMRLMTETGFQEQARAEKKLLRAKLDSTQLAQYFLGWSELNDLERDWRKQVGDKFERRAFDEALVGHGTIAVRYLRDYLLPRK